jgi:hypothetical protein
MPALQLDATFDFQGAGSALTLTVDDDKFGATSFNVPRSGRIGTSFRVWFDILPVIGSAENPP